MDPTFSIQIFQWEQQRSIAFRNTGKLPIFCIKADPFDYTKFMTCGYQHIAQWSLNGKHLTCNNFIHVDNEHADLDKEDEKAGKKHPKVIFLIFRRTSSHCIHVNGLHQPQGKGLVNCRWATLLKAMFI
jgi:hypothetical protein